MPVKRAIRILVYPIHHFLKLEALGGLLLISAAILALILSNSGVGADYERFWESPIGFHLGAFTYSNTLHFLVNEGLMTLFFLFIGLQIKKELLIGVLASRKRATLPLFAAAGGLILPALIYLLINPPGTPGSPGWGIPIATDIAFVMGVLMLLGKRIPLALKIFLLAMAIVDDLGGILVITFLYSAHLNWFNLVIGAILTLLLFIFSSIDYREMPPYLMIGACLWLALLHSGIPPTIAGVVLATAIPSKPLIFPKDFGKEAKGILEAFKALKENNIDILHHDEYHAGIHALAIHCRNALTPLQHLENILHPWVNFFILPLFALANAGVSLKGGDLGSIYQSPVIWGILFGLCLGKPLGISLSVWLATRLKLAALPKGVSLNQLIAASFLGGIGFTMSLFISYLAFAETPLLIHAKIGIFVALPISVTLGCLLLWFFLKKCEKQEDYDRV